jgi:hypothetical protein
MESRNIKQHIFFFVTFIILCSSKESLAQQTNNSSTLNNSAAPSASSITSGGTNVNNQSNNSFNNENGFGPGVFCRTPSLYLGGNWGRANQENLDIASNTSTNNNQNYSANVGVVVPFGSSILQDCAELSRQITLDRKISTELSLIRACSQLEKEGIKVDAIKFPYLEKCAGSSTAMLGPDTPTQKRAGNTPNNIVVPKIPKTNKS